jgi:hypothetical protein
MVDRPPSEVEDIMSKSDIEQVAEDAQANYDLEARLRGRPMRERGITLFTDEVKGEELGGVEEIRNQLQMVVGKRRWGLIGDLDLLEQVEGEKDQAAIDDLKAKIAAKREELAETGVTVKLRAVPEIIVKDTRRKAKRYLGVKGKVGEDQIEDYSEEITNQVLAVTIQSIEFHEDDYKVEKVNVADARNLRSFLPPSEFDRLDRKLYEIQFQASISEQATDNTDF